MSVPELFIKNRKSAVEKAKERADRITKQRIVHVDLKKHATEAFTKYEAEYKKVAADLIAAEQAAEKKGSFYVAAESKFMLVIRIKGIAKMTP